MAEPLRPSTYRQSRPTWTPNSRSSGVQRIDFSGMAQRAQSGSSGRFAQRDESGNGGISGNLGSVAAVVRGMPSGVAGLIGETGSSALGFGRLAKDAITGNTDEWSDDFGTNARNYFPIIESFRDSYARTGRNLVDPSRYLDAWREGQGITTVIEDVGNLALPTMAAGKAATALGFEGAGARLGNIARLGDQFGAAPAKVWTVPARGLNQITRPAGGRTISELASSSVNRYLSREGAGPTSNRIAQAIDPQTRAARRDLSDSGTRIASAQAAPLEQMALRFRNADPNLLNAAVVEGQTQFYNRIGQHIKGLPDEQFAKIVDDTFGDGLTPKAARLAIDAAEGRLDAKAQATFDEAIEAHRAIRETGDDMSFARDGETPEAFTARTGRIEGPADPAQLGDTPMRGKIDTDRRVMRLRRGAETAETRKIPELSERATRLRAQADAQKALSRPVAEPPSQGAILRRGRQQGRTQAKLTAQRSQVRALQRELDNAIDDLVLADDIDAGTLNDLAAAAEKATDNYNSAVDNYNSAVRQVEAATSLRPTNRSVGRVTSRITKLVNDLQKAEDLGLPTEQLRRELAEARREYSLSRDAAGAEVTADAPNRVASDRRIGGARAELKAARREANAAQRQLDNAAAKSGQTPKSLVTTLEKAQRRLADAEGGVASLESELDAQLAFNGPEATPSLRGTYSRGAKAGRYEQRAMSAETAVRKAERQLTRMNEQLAKRVASLSEATGAATPKRWRQVAAESDRASSAILNLADEIGDPALATKLTQIADEIPKTLDELKAAGVDPAYLIGGYLPERAAKSLRQQNAGLPRIGRTTSSRQAKSMVTDYRYADQAVQEAVAARRAAGNIAGLKFADDYGAKAASVIGDTGLTGRELAKAMRDAGYVAWDPKGIFNALDDAAVKPDTVFLPKNLHDAFAYTMQTASPNWAVSGLLNMNQAWKNVLLPISPSWYIGNTFGNALMAMVGSGMDPLTYTRNMVAGIQDMRRNGGVKSHMLEGEAPSASPRRLRTAGLTYAESGALDPNRALRQPRTALGRGYQRTYGRGATLAYNINEFLDNLNKNAVYLHELERAKTNPAARSALGITDVGEAGVRQAEEYATREALRIMGDFSRMAPWERSAVAAMPFYRWARHITQLTVRMPIEHPMRVAWALKIPQLFGEDQSDLPGWLQGNLAFGDWVLPVNFLNPYGDIAGTVGPLGLGGALADPDSFARSLSPFIKMPIAAATGVDLGSGFGAELSMPTADKRLDPNSGRPTRTGLIGLDGAGLNLSGLANYASTQLPLTRNLRDLVQGDYPRYDTGERIESLDPRQPFYQGPARLTQLIGLPEPIHISDVESARSRLQANLELARNR